MGTRLQLAQSACRAHTDMDAPFLGGDLLRVAQLLTALSLAVCKVVRRCARSLHLPEVQGAVWGSV